MLDRIPVVGGIARSLRGDRLGLMIEVHAARGGASRPGLDVIVTNLCPQDLYLESIGMTFRDGSAFGDWVGVDLAVGSAPHVAWFGLAELSERIGRRDPVHGLTHVFAATTDGTSKLPVDRRRLLAELHALDAAEG